MKLLKKIERVELVKHKQIEKVQLVVLKEYQKINYYKLFIININYIHFP